MSRCAAWCVEGNYRPDHPCERESSHIVYIKGKGIARVCSTHRGAHQRGTLKLAERPRRLTP